MDQNTEENLDKSQRNCYMCGTTTRKIYILILLIAVFNIAIWGSLVAAHLYQRNEIRELRTASAKAIAECRRHAALINAKLHQDFRNNKSNERNIIRKSSRNTKRFKDSENMAPQQARSQVQTSCPYRSQKRRKLCSFIAKEVSRHVQLNLTALRKEIKNAIVAEVSRHVQLNLTALRKEIKNAIDAEDRSKSVYVNLPGKFSQDNLRKLKMEEKDMYRMRWDKPLLKMCQQGIRKDYKNRKELIERCRVARLSSKRDLKPIVEDRAYSKILVKVPGIYFVYCQLTLTIDDSEGSKNVAHNISKITIMMSRDNGEHIELISQVPVLTKQGNERFITASMFTQAYLYLESSISVTISFRNLAKIPTDDMKVILYNEIRKNMTFNVFGMYLLKKTQDGP